MLLNKESINELESLKGIVSSPDLRRGIERIIELHLVHGDYDSLSTDLENFTGSRLISSLLAWSLNKDFFAELDTLQLGGEFLEWLKWLSKIYAFPVMTLWVKENRRFDWKDLRHVICSTGGYFYSQIDILRNDGEILRLEGDRQSFFNLLRSILSSVANEDNSKLSKEEETALRDISNQVNTLLSQNLDQSTTDK